MDDKESEQRGRAIVQSLAVIVQSMVQPVDAVPAAYAVRTKFEAFRAPNISIRDYLMRINKYASCSPECFVLALVYIDRLHQMQGLTLTELNVHRVLITSVVLAAKFFDDHYFNNAYYSKVGGVPCSEMNELEVEFLLMTNFTLHVSTDVYVRYYNELANHYVSSNLQSGTPGPQFRPYVVMDPEQTGQLIYVAEGELTEPPLPACDEPFEQDPQQQQEEEYEQQQYEQQQQQQYQQHYEQQITSAAVYAYQQPPKPQAASFANGHHVVSAQQHASEQHHQGPPRPVYTYDQQHADPYRHEKQAVYGHVHEQYNHAPRGPAHVYQPTHVTNPYASSKHGVASHPFQPPHHHHQYNHHTSAHYHTHQTSIADGTDPYHSSSTAMATMNGKYTSGLPPAPAASVSSSSANGIVYANSGRTSGQKRRKSIALGVNA